MTIPVRLLFCCLLPVLSSGSERHSLWAMASYMTGSTHFPEFSVVLMLDDVQVGYYDSESQRVTSVGGGKEAELGLGRDVEFVLQDVLSSMRKRLHLVQRRLNLTDGGVHVWQRLVGCEGSPDGDAAYILNLDAVESQAADSVQYNLTHFTYTGGAGWEFSWDAVKQTYVQMLYSNIYLPVCLRTLRHLMERHRPLLMRRVKPRLRLLAKPVLGGAQITCLATDFYPRHIQLTLLRDGEPVPESELSGGAVLPNANGLYQVRKVLLTEGEELSRRHRYTCSATHLSLDNRLDVSWREEPSRTYQVFAISVPVATASVIFLLMLLRWMKRAGSQGSAMETDQCEPETGVKETMLPRNVLTPP